LKRKSQKAKNNFLTPIASKKAKFTKFGIKKVNLATLAKLASGLLYSWSLLRNNNTAINLQMFTSRYGSRLFGAWDQGSH